MALLALGRTRIFFLSRLAGIVAFLGATIVLGRMAGFEGVLWANILSHAVATTLIIREALISADVFGPNDMILHTPVRGEPGMARLPSAWRLSQRHLP